MQKKKHIHFMGIGGSALAGVAILAKKIGFEVSGCDIVSESYYTKFLKAENIKPIIGHSEKHIKDADILAVSPAIFDLSNDHPEVVEARKKRILMTWQEFMGKYLQKDKFVIAIAGTHGKSTTTALAGLALAEAGLDPIVEVGAIVPQWGKTIRLGESKYFICEADEFNNNFLNYSPSIAIINNIEMDHPEFFKDFADFREAFRNFVKRLTGPKVLIVNEESKGIQMLLIEMEKWLKQNKVKVVAYYLEKAFNYPFDSEYRGEIVRKGPNSSTFTLTGKDIKEEFDLTIPGIHNVANSMGVLVLAKELGINLAKIKSTLKSFKGLGRRFSLAGEEKGIKVFDDYSVHPTAVMATINAARQKYPENRLWIVYEPHQYSRLNLFFDDFVKVMKLADKVIVTAPYEGRERGARKPDMVGFTRKIGEKAMYLPEFEKVADRIVKVGKRGDKVIVAGAGKSYALSQLILKKLKKAQ